MRSCDIYTHFCNDVYLSIRLLEYVAEKVGMKVGNFQQTVFSLHAYRKDFEDTIF
jgi:thymidylate synthase